ncbi:MAG: c-type cytochrome, partial [Bryobacterales bacterium]|nr:c-type cytochrome [Bryobacterales bacterium]
YELDGVQYLAVPSGGIGGDMTFYYTEPRAGNIWVFALDGGGPAQVAPGTNLTTLEGGLPHVGQPGHTLGGRVLPGYGFEPTEGGEPLKVPGPPLPTEASAAVAEQADRYFDAPEDLQRVTAVFRARCIGCHKVGGSSGPNLFRTRLAAREFVDKVLQGGNGMPTYVDVLDDRDILELHALVASRDRL